MKNLTKEEKELVVRALRIAQKQTENIRTLLIENLAGKERITDIWKDVCKFDDLASKIDKEF